MKNIYEMITGNCLIIGDITSTGVLSDPVNNEKIYSDIKLQIRDDEGFYNYSRDDLVIAERSQAEKEESSTEPNIGDYKQQKKQELFDMINNNWIEVLLHRTLGQDPDKTPVEALTAIINQWDNIKTASASWTTKQEVDAAFDNALTWLGLD